jgi:phosphatidylserine/phosphatidylglycerophosphate/cardiolipin synthase-like enzyme
MIAALRVALALAALLLGACAHAPMRVDPRAAEYAEQARSSQTGCYEQPCQLDSPLLALGDAAYAESTPAAPRHRVILLDAGQDSLLARVHLIRAARKTIDLQTFHFEPDDAGRVVLDELIAAAKRGVKVRLMMDQLNGLARPLMQARLASFHHNFELRIYNPVFSQADISTFEFAASVVFRLKDLNRRMHNKMMIVDDRVAIIGGRNIQDEYFDWHPAYNYRDRDLLVAGPVTQTMEENFNGFWNDYRSAPPTALSDVIEVLLANKGPPPDDTPPASERVHAMAAKARDGAAVFARLQPYTYTVGPVEFYGDLPTKHDDVQQSREDATKSQLDALSGGRREILLQTPYLVLSRPARKLFREIHQRQPELPILVSTNSLAATDAFPAYAMSHKYKRMFLRELGFQIHEYKPFPADMPIDLQAIPGAMETLSGQGGIADPPGPGDEEALEDAHVDPQFRPSGFRQGPVPLKSAGVRIGLHSKSMVIDEQVAIVGSHNFDPRSTDYNTESLLLVRDPVFAKALADSIRRDMEPGNAWTIAPKPKAPVLWGLNYNLGKASEKLPIFDIWPFPYATSYELKQGCQPLPPNDPGFPACYQDVGDFPEVNLSLKMVYTRVLTVFGAGFIPFL